MTAGTVTVLIATPLEAGNVARIAAADPRLEVIYEPGLLPVPQYAADHGGTPRDLSEDDLARWADLRARAEVSFDFDSQTPPRCQGNCPRLRWVQGTSAGIGGFLQRTGLDQTDLMITTEPACTVCRSPSSASWACSTSSRTCPACAAPSPGTAGSRGKPRCCPATRACYVGLGGIGRQVAATLSAAGAEVIGVGRPGRTYDVPGVTAYTADTALDDVTPPAGALSCLPAHRADPRLIGPRPAGTAPAGAVLVNVARGAVVDEAAIARPSPKGTSAAPASTSSRKSCPRPPRSGTWTTSSSPRTPRPR